jgi:hypothetical protein
MEMQQTHSYATRTVTLLWKRNNFALLHSNVDIIVSREPHIMQHHQGNPICHIAPSLRLLVPGSPQVRRQSVNMSHYDLRSKVALDLVDRVVDSSDVW